MTVSLEKATAQDVMSKDVVSIHPQEHVHEALQLMAENGLSMLPVANGLGECVGVLSQVDLVRLTSSLDDDDHDPIREPQSMVNGPAKLSEITNERIDDVMSTAVVSVTPDASVTEVTDVMLDHAIHHLPVLSEENRLLGIISTLDVLAAVRQV